MTAPLFLSASDATPMYQQVVDQVMAKVVAGDWPAGTALPSIRELASASNVSVITVKRAYQELERSGVIVTRQGKGSFVSESLDAPRAVLRAELDALVQAVVDHAEQLGLPREELHELIDEASPTPAHSTRGTRK